MKKLKKEIKIENKRIEIIKLLWKNNDKIIVKNYKAKAAAKSEIHTEIMETVGSSANTNDIWHKCLNINCDNYPKNTWVIEKTSIYIYE